MKVLHVIPSIGPARGGPSISLPVVVGALARRNCDVTVVTTDDNGADRLDIPVGRPFPMHGATFVAFSRTFKPYTFSGPLVRWLAANVAQYDLVHIHALFSFPSVAASFFSRRAKVPYVLRPLGTLNRWGMATHPVLKRTSLAIIERRYLKHAAAVHFTSLLERTETELLKLQMTAVIIPNPVEMPLDIDPTPLLESNPRLKRGPVILFLSRIDPVKGLDLLLEAFAAVCHQFPQATLCVVGDGPPSLIDSLKSLAREVGVERNVVWIGPLSYEDRWQAFRVADIFVLPSRSENFGVATGEAMAAGVPVVVTEGVGLAAEIAARGCGIVVRRKRDQLAVAIIELLKNRVMREESAVAGRSFAEEYLSQEAVGEQLIGLYSSILSDGPNHGDLS